MSPVLIWKDARWRSSPELPAVETSQNVDYGVRDSKGRAIGGYAEIVPSAEWVDGTEPLPNHHRADGRPVMRKVPSGRVLFHVRTNATRDGKPFGAIPRSTIVDSMDAAKALAEKKIEAAKARFAKLVAKGEGRQFKERSP